ncbi:MAG: ATP-binding protein [Acidobacteriota bacterium]
MAAGNLAYRVRSEAFDEFAGLIASFNRMTMDLEENEKHIEQTQQSLRRTNIELDDRRRYIETILQTIATGVISLDKHGRIRTMNRAAMEMLQIDESPVAATLEDIIQAPACGVLHGLLAKAEVLGSVVRNMNLKFAGKSLQLAIIATPLQDSKGEHVGWVLVLDDVTELLRMEKLTAWQEVARRLAHEIKNPLTPIQLSAERVLQRFKQLGKPPDIVRGAWRNELEKFDALIEDCIQTIIQEAASLKGLVDEFSRFARLPEIKLVDTDLHAVMDLTLSLYDGRIRNVEIIKDYDPEMPPLKLDPEQMKRVFVNLFDNALEAMAQNDSRKELILRTRLKTRAGKVIIEVGDTGRGFPREYQGSLFLPYFSGREGGTGLGLAIVRQIVSDHNGNIHAEANIPEGTKIVIDLPLAAV